MYTYICIDMCLYIYAYVGQSAEVVEYTDSICAEG